MFRVLLIIIAIIIIIIVLLRLIIISLLLFDDHYYYYCYCCYRDLKLGAHPTPKKPPLPQMCHLRACGAREGINITWIY